MNGTAKFAPCILILLSLVSCEEVIDLDLGHEAPRIVIEGLITDKKGPYHVKISQSVDYQEINNFPPVSGAKVKISDGKGYSEILEEVAEGIYETNRFRGEKGISYFLEIAYEEEIFSASSTIPETEVPINSISYHFVEESFFNEEGYYMTAYFSDPAHEVNYYRLKVFVNGEPYFFESEDNLIQDDNFWLINDKFFNGQIIDYEFPHKLKPGDKIDIELHQVDSPTFEYYRTLMEVMGIGGVAPSNPLTNLSHGALGYFGAVSITHASTVIKE